MGAFEAEPCDRVQCISVVVLPDPGALARVVEPFAKLGVVPLSVNSRLFADVGQLAIDIQIAGMGEEQGLRIARQIESFPITLQVVTGQKYLVTDGTVEFSR
jgi:acetolactate synthase small subunit